ncbi:hypothetical protein [Helicobacter sp.]|uniref:hypothetical protein n=1 Tax=Helicobacter sp. TaxID=218 RepID=UPI002A75FC03|nr:hypothetical protein [Helicobacter sp.]MDY2585202.1 hypothetical protein [Helicobacter sp.]
MQQLSFIKFKTSIKAEDYLILREILQEDVEIAFVSDFYSVDFFNYLYRCGGGGDYCSF